MGEVGEVEGSRVEAKENFGMMEIADMIGDTNRGHLPAEAPKGEVRNYLCFRLEIILTKL